MNVVGRSTRLANSFRVVSPFTAISRSMSARSYYAQQAANTQRAVDAPVAHNVTALKRWSILNNHLPAKEDIKAIHIYDFDNTLFKTPLPNPNIWNNYTIGQLANPDIFVNGGWWHDSRILAATGEGLEKEEPRAWEGWWNEKIIDLIRLSEEQPDALTVLLTGRSESGFSDLIKRMVAAKKLNFDMISLKPAVGPNHERFSSTMQFKQEFLKALMETYHNSEEIRIYEDRPKHVQGFRSFLTEYNKKQNGAGRTRGPITAEVILVPDQATTLDPIAEVAEVQLMLNEHNEAVKNKKHGPRQERLKIHKTVFYTGYLIKSADTERLIKLAEIPANIRQSEIKYHGNNIMICSRPCPESILGKVGGLGAKMMWEVTGIACFDNSIWAARLAPVPPTAPFYTEHKNPHVVLALRKGSRPIDAGRIQNWQPVPPDKALIFETTVGEKMLLSIERESSGKTDNEGLVHSKAGFKRKHSDDDHGYHGHQRGGYGGGPGGRDHHRNFHTGRGGRGGRGGGGQGRGGWNQRGGRGGGGAKGGRGGRGGGHHYKSLDDVAAARANEGGFKQGVSYEDDNRSYTAPQQQAQQQQQQHVPQGPAAFYNQQAQYQAPYQQPQQQYGGWQGQPQQQQGQNQPGGGAGGYGAGGPELYY